MTYGSIIKQAREECRMTQEQLAEQLDISRQAVSKWEADLSRPTWEKLDRLSEILNISPEIWAEIDAEMEAASAIPDTSQPWKIATAALAAVCVILLVCLIAGRRPREETQQNAFQEEAQPPAEPAKPPAQEEPASVLPDSFPLVSSHDYSFGDRPVGTYDREEIPFLDDWEQVMDSELWCGWFPDGTRLSLVSAAASWDPEYTHVYLLYAPPVETTGNELEYHIFLRVGEDYIGEDRGAPDAREFTNVLGYDGFRISRSLPERRGAYRDSFYIIQGSDGRPRMMTNTFADTIEADVDDDGVLELVYFDSDYAKWQITDTIAGEEGAFTYKLHSFNLILPDEYTFACDPGRGGFIITDAANAIISRCVLRDGELVRVPPTDFSVLDYPDVAGTRITFIMDEEFLYDGLEPDVILPYNPDVRITHRQQAYLALQELYNLTGWKVDSCYCAAGEFGVVFSLVPDGLNQREFYSVWFGADHGCMGDPIPSIHINWKELAGDWSPLSAAQAVLPDTREEGEAMLWYYDRMELFRNGAPASAGLGELWLENGDLYNYYVESTDYGPVLTSIYGPYPGGIVNH